jgi:AcrR family transcriptional regulator
VVQDRRVTGGLTERKARTRRALVDRALELIAERGFDAVTAEDIALAAGVSPRTFFRYFPTKESVLLFGEVAFVNALTAGLAGQPRDRSDAAALRVSAVALAAKLAPLHRRIGLYQAALRTSHVLRGQEREQHELNAEVLSSALADRRGLPRPDAACRLLAVVTLTTLEQALFDWARGQAEGDLGRLVDQRFQLLESLMAEAGR